MAKREDFRWEAAQRSERLLRERGIDPMGDLRAADVSLCVLIDPDGAARSRAIEVRTNVILTLAIAGFFAVLGLAAWLVQFEMPIEFKVGLIVADVLAGVGMLVTIFLRGKKDHTWLLDELRARPNSMVPVNEKNAGSSKTFFIVDMQRRKGDVTIGMVRDDCGVLVPDADRNRVLLDTRGYRHVIFPRDVVLAKAVSSGGSIGVDVVYEVDGLEVALHMFASSLSDGFRANLGHSVANPIADAVLDILDPLEEF